MVSTTDSDQENTDHAGYLPDDGNAVSSAAEPPHHEAQDLYRDGVAAAVEGKRATAERLLRASLALDARNHQAWFWLAGVVKSPEESIQCLERVLELTPDDPRALEGLEWAKQRLESQTSVAAVQDAIVGSNVTDGRERTEMVASRPLASSAKAQASRVMWIALAVSLILLALAVVLGVWLALGQGRSSKPGEPGGSTPTAPAPIVIVPSTPGAPVLYRVDRGESLQPTGAMLTQPPGITARVLSSLHAEESTHADAAMQEPIVAIAPAVPALSSPVRSTHAGPETSGFRPDWYSAGSPLAFLNAPDWRTLPAITSVPESHGDPNQPVKHPGKWIDVDISDQTLRAFEEDRIVMDVKVSSGPATAPTVEGTFRIQRKYRAIDMWGMDYYVPAVPYAMFFYDGYAIHGAYWHHRFGQPTGHGCVNMRPEDARRLFEWAEPRSAVEAHSANATRPEQGTMVVVHE